jgi:hypothetical protein
MLLSIAIGCAACAAPGAQMREMVRDQAMADLACDAASLSITQLRPTTKVADGRRGKIERTTYAAKGCGDYRAYVVECIKGSCKAEPIVEDPEEKQKKLQSGGTP